jgi:outer membrane protein
MKYIFKALFLLIFFLTQYSIAYSKNIVFLDFEFAITNSNIGKKTLDNLEKINSEENEKLKIIEQSLNKKNEEINNLKNIASKEKIEKKIKEFQEEINKFNIEKNKVQKKFIANKNKQLDELLKKINPLIIEYMSDNSIELILSKKSVYLGKTELDITENILKIINENFK